MIYFVEPKIFEDFPTFYRGVVIASGVDNTDVGNAELEALFRQRIKEVEADPAIFEGHPRIKAWAEIYSHFPLKDARKILPSVASLVRRIKKGRGQDIPFISPLVCISNLASLTHLMPSGLIDADKVSGDLVLGFALGSEEFTPIGGDEVVSPEIGEIIYYDSLTRNVLCRAWNSRGGKATLISPNTRSAVIDVDGLLDVVAKEEIETAAYNAAALVEKHCRAEVSVHFLSATRPSIDVPL